ncbi:MAG: glycosyltransferase family 4 protein [Verrucomicrobiales bacterium]|nr:glycosyltransferase family 4 protein [Verrucomicrobiales bacterium]
MHLAIDAVGIREGGGLTILRGFVEYLSLRQSGDRYTVFVGEEGIQIPRFSACDVRIAPFGSGRVSRIAWQQFGLPVVASRIKADVVLAFVNSGSFFSPLPQCVYCQQILPFEPEFVQKFDLSIRLQLRVQKMLMVGSAAVSDLVVVQTRAMGDRLSSGCGGQRIRKRVVISPPGVALNSGIGEVSQCVRSVSERCRHPTLLYVSSLGVHKNHPNLIKAFGLLLKKYPEASVVLTIGSKSQVYPDLMAEIDSLVEGSPRPQSIFRIGTVTPTEVSFLLRHCDVAVFPSVVESFGLPLIEAMAAGVPVSASDRPYAREVLGEAGSFFDPFEPLSIEAAIDSVIRSPSMRRDMVNRGLKRAKAFCGDVSYSHLYDIIAGIVRSSSGSRIDDSLGAARG